MRIALFLLFFGILYTHAAEGFSQETSFTLNVKSTSIKDICEEIERNSDYRFIFAGNAKSVINHKVSIMSDSQNIEEILSIILNDTELAYKILDNQVVIYRSDLNVINNQVEKLISSEAIKQQRKITGKIRDSENAPIIGANIIESGTLNGTVTDINGEFSLQLEEDAVLHISYIGYLSQEINTMGKTYFDIILFEDLQALDELVIIGYGTQRKVNLTGAVSSVNIAELSESRPITNVSTGLAGLVPGLHVSSASNRPGYDSANLLIRGQGTLNNSAPLIIVDGIETNISDVNPSDIESLSVLKDAASSSIYGSRAANGVILITTKKGAEGVIKLNVNSYLSNLSAAKTIEPVSNYADYMQLMNEAMVNSGRVKPFSEGMIQLWRENEGKDPLKYPNTDWRDDVLHNALAQNYSVSLSGGTDKISFFSSFRYLNNPGIMENTGISRYDLRVNISAKLKDWITIGTNITGNKYNYSMVSNSTISTIFNGAPGTPGMVLRSPDGRFGAPNNIEDNTASSNPLRNLNATTGEDIELKGRTQFFAQLTPFKGLSVDGSFSYFTVNRQTWQKGLGTKTYNFLYDTVASEIANPTTVNNSTAYTHQYITDATISYENKVLNNLTYKTLVGISQETFSFENFGASKLDLLDPSLRALNAATGTAGASGNKYEWAMRSYFGRLQLNWDDKYLVEMNLRGDGSSRFAKTNRWGYFPSLSAGWRIDQEEFMEAFSLKWLSNFKVRASYGSLGNNSVGNYETIPLYSVATYVLNGEIEQAIRQNSIVNQNLEWEKTYVTNLGLDISLLKNKLSGTIDVFNKRTEGILIALPAPLVNGFSILPKQNSASVVNKGIEFSLAWENNIDEFHYYINSNFSFIRNKVIKYKGDEYTMLGTGIIKEGLPIGTQYLLEADRIVSNEDDLALVESIIDNAPVDEATGVRKNPFAAFGRPGLGDILYKDIDSNGIIDSDDRKTFGRNGTNPLFTYGFNLGFSYKRFDFSTLIQGVGDYKIFYSDPYYSPYLALGVGINKEIAEGRWHKDRSTPAKFPKLMEWSGSTQNTLASSFWLVDKSYLKIKNIQLGYSLPNKLTVPLQAEKIRIYTSFENFFTFTSYPGIDPEVFNTSYPTMRQVVFGVNLTL